MLIQLLLKVYHDEEIDPLSANLVSLDGVKWRRLRSKLSPIFTSAKIKSMFDSLLRCAEQLEHALGEHVHKHEPVEIGDLMARLTTDNIG